MKKLVILLLFLLPLTGCLSNDEIGIKWINYEEWEMNKEKPAILYFYYNDCQLCEKMEKEIFANEKIIEKAKNFDMIKINVEEQVGMNIAYKYKLQYTPYFPAVLFLASNGTELFRILVQSSVNEFLQKMDDALKGKMGEDFSFELLDGRNDNLKNYRGKIVIVDFMATWCQPCHMQMNELNKVLEYFGNEIQIISLDVGKDNAEKIRNSFATYINKWIFGIDKYGIASKYLFQGGIPTLAIFDKHGRLLFLVTGVTHSQQLIDIINDIKNYQ